MLSKIAVATIVLEMTYTVSSGMLNTTVPIYHGNKSITLLYLYFYLLILLTLLVKMYRAVTVFKTETEIAVFFPKPTGTETVVVFGAKRTVFFTSGP